MLLEQKMQKWILVSVAMFPRHPSATRGSLKLVKFSGKRYEGFQFCFHLEKMRYARFYGNSAGGLRPPAAE
jgi:hypothetical protein